MEAVREFVYKLKSIILNLIKFGVSLYCQKSDNAIGQIGHS